MKKNTSMTERVMSAINGSGKSQVRIYLETTSADKTAKPTRRKNALANMADILAAVNEQVANLMGQGYMISFMNSSFGYKFRVDMERGKQHIRVKVEEVHELLTGRFELTVLEISDADRFEEKDATVFYSKTWYVIDEKRNGDYILTDSKEAFDTALQKMKERSERKYGTTAHKAGKLTPSGILTPTAALIRKLKGRKGFTNATRDRILVIRVADGYEVSLKARDGHIRRREVIRLRQH